MTANPDKFAHLQALPQVLEVDLDYINKKDRSYGASWKRRGGVGAFMMLARKWDRLENMLSVYTKPYDIFDKIEDDGHFAGGQGADGTVLAEVRDLRRYLALVEAEMVARGVVMAVSVPATSGAGGGNSGDALVEAQGAGEPGWLGQVPAGAKLNGEDLTLGRMAEIVRASGGNVRWGDEPDLYQQLADKWKITRAEAKRRTYEYLYQQDLTAVGKLSEDEVQLVKDHRAGVEATRAMAADMRGRQSYKVGDPVQVHGQYGVVQPAVSGYSSDFVAVRLDSDPDTLVFHHSLVQPRFTTGQHRTYKTGPDGVDQPLEVGDPVYVKGYGQQFTIRRIVGALYIVDHPTGPRMLKVPLADLTYARHARPAEQQPTKNDSTEPAQGAPDPTLAGWQPQVPVANAAAELLAGHQPGTPEDGGHHAAADDDGAPAHYRRYLTHSEWHYHMREQIKWGTLQGSTLEALYELTSDDAVEDHYVAMLPQHVEEYAL